MDRNKLSQIEKKMDMSLDDIIKANKAKTTRPSAAPRKAGAGISKPGRAPLIMGKGQGGAKASKGQAPKMLGAKAGIAGKRQAIQQKKAVAKVTAGVRVKPAGSIAKPATKRAGTMAQRILNKARQSKQQAPKQLAMKGKGQQAPKQLANNKQARKPIQFSGNAKQQPQRQLHQQNSAPKSLAQRMSQQRKGGNNGSVGKQQHASARAPIRLGNAANNPRRRRGGAGIGGNSGPAPMQLDRPMAGGVRKHQQRAPIFQQSRGQQQMPRQAPLRQQQQRAPLGPRAGTAMPPRMGGVSNGRGYGGVPVQQMRGPRQAPINPLEIAKRDAALQALRMQQLEDERNRAERRLYMHQQMSMMEQQARGARERQGSVAGGARQAPAYGGGFAAAPRAAPIVVSGRMGSSSRGY